MPLFLPTPYICEREWVPVSKDESRIDINGGGNRRLRRVSLVGIPVTS